MSNLSSTRCEVIDKAVAQIAIDLALRRHGTGFCRCRPATGRAIDSQDVMVSVSPFSRQRPVSTSSSAWPLTQERNWAAKAPSAPIWAIHICRLVVGLAGAEPGPNQERRGENAASSNPWPSTSFARLSRVAPRRPVAGPAPGPGDKASAPPACRHTVPACRPDRSSPRTGGD